MAKGKDKLGRVRFQSFAGFKVSRITAKTGTIATA
jgi:hypothetical protein